MTSKVSAGTTADKRMPTSTRLSRFERAFLKIAVAQVQRDGRDNYHVSDFLREAGLEKAERILGQRFTEYSSAA